MYRNTTLYIIVGKNTLFVPPAKDVQRDIAYKIIVGCDFQHELEVNLAATTANKIL